MAEILSMNDTGSKITICNDIMDENFYIKGIIFIMMCHEYKPKLVTTFPPQISVYTIFVHVYLILLSVHTVTI